ncbi:hypothetical protein GCM10022228_11050 [Halomonas cibimaris]|uniref:Uncharacterized protein n=1 Tax=Halomonas cibimaris TaxID=657012 RepID=A0ABP7LMD5_9GAMM
MCEAHHTGCMKPRLDISDQSAAFILYIQGRQAPPAGRCDSL